MIITKPSTIISTRNYVEQTFTSLQVNQTLSQYQQFIPIRKEVHTTLSSCNRFGSDLFASAATLTGFFAKKTLDLKKIARLKFSAFKLTVLLEII